MLSGCAKYSSDCDLILRPRVVTVAASLPSGGQAAYDVSLYAFYLSGSDIENWAPLSYADAASGTVRNIETGEILPYSLMGNQSDDTYVHMALSRSPVLLVAVDRYNEYYAWRSFEYKVPLNGPITMTLLFLLYQADPSNSHWKVVRAADEDGEG